MDNGKYYAVTMMAWHTIDDKPRLAVTTVVVRMETGGNMDDVLTACHEDAFPSSEGWFDHSHGAPYSIAKAIIDLERTRAHEEVGHA